MMAKPWNEFRPIITQLYISEGRTLEDVRGIMKAEYGFIASIRSYRQHFDMWCVGKYNCKKRQLRRQKSHALAQGGRNLLPSPPRTPITGPMPPMDLAMANHDAVTVGTAIPMASPPDSAVSIGSSGQASAHTGRHSPHHHHQHHLQRPVLEPLASQARLFGLTSPRYGSMYDSHAAAAYNVRRRSDPARNKCLQPLGPSPGVWGEHDIQAALRSSSMAEGMLPSLPLEAPGMDPSKLPEKYFHAVHSYSDMVSWNAPRSDAAAMAAVTTAAPTTTFHLSNPEPDYFRLSYHDTVPRHMPEPFPLGSTPASYHHQRPGEYQTIHSTATSPSTLSVASQPMDRLTGGSRETADHHSPVSQAAFGGINTTSFTP